MIHLGLSRVLQLLAPSLPLPWRAVHVAGTNGKGSICVYLSEMLRAADIRCGRFTSPHLIDRWDGINIDGTPVSESLFRSAQADLLRRNEDQQIGATEFELMTATAFELFASQKADVAVIEVGLGGRLDATNVLQSPLATVIAKIGLDHQAFLGDTIAKIAAEKAGILKPRVPCIVDGSNEGVVIDTILAQAEKVGAGPVRIVSPSEVDRLLSSQVQDGLAPHQRMNLACAVSALQTTLKQLGRKKDLSALAMIGKSASFPARLQSLDVSRLTARVEPVLLDGAHNPQAAQALSAYVTANLRSTASSGVTWLFAATKGKDIKEIASTLFHPGDRVVAVEFGPVDDMPWVEPTHAESIKADIEIVHRSEVDVQIIGSDILEGLLAATKLADGSPMVVAGSLYLASDVLRLLRDTQT
jgi:folylpolyglutamate synthase/dihydrofolate synthase